MSVAPAGVALTGNTPGPESKYRLAPNRNNQWPSRLQILIQLSGAGPGVTNTLEIVSHHESPS